MIEISSLRFRYPASEFVLNVPRLSVGAGEQVVVLGPSGSGKTTLLHLVAGIVVPEAGSITTCGVEVNELTEEERRAFRVRKVGLVFQAFELLEYLTVLDNILLAYRLSPQLHLEASVHERARGLARDVGLEHLVDRRADRLSQGEKQRVAVCRALLPGPGLLLADEPTGNLDPANKDRVLDELLEASRRTSATLVMVTHDHSIGHRFDRVVDFSTLREPA